jgi:hypothetical protein
MSQADRRRSNSNRLEGLNGALTGALDPPVFSCVEAAEIKLAVFDLALVFMVSCTQSLFCYLDI